MENVGALIRERRKELGLKVFELAKKVGVNPVYITQIEKHNKLPSHNVFMKIEEVLGRDSDIYMPYLKAKYPKVYKEAMERNTKKR